MISFNLSRRKLKFQESNYLPKFLQYWVAGAYKSTVLHSFPPHNYTSIKVPICNWEVFIAEQEVCHKIYFSIFLSLFIMWKGRKNTSLIGVIYFSTKHWMAYWSPHTVSGLEKKKNVSRTQSLPLTCLLSTTKDRLAHWEYFQHCSSY